MQKPSSSERRKLRKKLLMWKLRKRSGKLRKNRGGLRWKLVSILRSQRRVRSSRVSKSPVRAKLQGGRSGSWWYHLDRSKHLHKWVLGVGEDVLK
jgi:hypothetical protein